MNTLLMNAAKYTFHVIVALVVIFLIGLSVGGFFGFESGTSQGFAILGFVYIFGRLVWDYNKRG